MEIDVYYRFEDYFEISKLWGINIDEEKVASLHGVKEYQ
jgi:hypothetical protein